MLSSNDEVPSGSGDPDSDVPPELFNDLEGKLDTAFVSTRRATAPDPNDMEPETPRDDFQIEQQPAAPSSKLGQDALDILHAEAEFSSGEKPPAASQEATIEPEPAIEPVEEIKDDDIQTPIPEAFEAVLADAVDVSEPTAADILEPAPVEPSVEIAEILKQVSDNVVAEPPVQEAAEEKPISEENDDLDEIRRRILELEEQESSPAQAEDEASVEAKTPDIPPQPELPEALDIPDFDPIPAEITQGGDNPFSRPASNGARETMQTSPSSTERQYEENIPFEEETPASKQHSINREIEDLIGSQTPSASTTDNTQDRPVRKIAPRPFPNIGDTDDLYDAAEEQGDQKPAEQRRVTPKDMFQDVDELSSEIASEAEQSPVEIHHPTAISTTGQSKGSFIRGFKYALIIYILIAVLYMFTPQIVKQIPQAEGFLNIITSLVEMVTGLLNPLIEAIKAMVG